MRDDARLGQQPPTPEEEKAQTDRMAAMLVEASHHVFSNGAKRSELKSRYDLLPQGPLKRIAKRFEIGLKYGEFNYMKGLPFDDTFNHIMDHLESYKERRKEYLRLCSNLDSGEERLFAEARKKLEYRLYTQAGAPANPVPGGGGTLPTSSFLSLKEWMAKTEPDGDDMAAAAWGCIAIMKMEELDTLA